ncbi:MAG TPA: hypothetical protein VGN07_14950 [Steroidobacteraceae bacterium]|jgi:hypothetical protein
MLSALDGCGSTPALTFTQPKTPEQIEADRQARAQEAATERFESCMDSTLSSFGPFRFGSQEARLKAAEICKDVMKQ